MLPSVLVVTINYNDLERTVAAVESVLAMEYPRLNVMVIDNASPDGSGVRLRARLAEQVEFVACATNLGYTGGCNLGFARALAGGFDYVWLLNNDAVVPRGTLDSVVRLAESDAAIGLVTPLIASLDDVPHLTFAGGILDVGRGIYDETNDVAEAQTWARENPGTGLVIGTAMLVKMTLVRAIGVLDERFFMYFEDIDYCARSLAAGFRNVVDVGATVYHLEKNKNTNPQGMKPHYWYYNARNLSRFWRKHLGLPGSARQMWWGANKFLRHRKQGNKEAGDAILAGLWDGWMDRGGAYDAGRRMPGAVRAAVELYARRLG